MLGFKRALRTPSQKEAMILKRGRRCFHYCTWGASESIHELWMSKKKGGLVMEKWNVYVLWLPYIKYSNLSWNWFFISFYAATKSRLLPPLMISVSRESLFSKAAFELWMLGKFIHCYFPINLSAAFRSTFHHLFTTL